jgi:hypothetical protein
MPDFTSLMTPSLFIGSCANNTQVMQRRMSHFDRFDRKDFPPRDSIP